MIDESKELLNKKWSDEERSLIKKIFDSLHSYRKFLPKALKEDIISVINLIIKIKTERDYLVSINKDLPPIPTENQILLKEHASGFFI